jgi:hypothetical protein
MGNEGRFNFFSKLFAFLRYRRKLVLLIVGLVFVAVIIVCVTYWFMNVFNKISSVDMRDNLIDLRISLRSATDGVSNVGSSSDRPLEYIRSAIGSNKDEFIKLNDVSGKLRNVTGVVNNGQFNKELGQFKKDLESYVGRINVINDEFLAYDNAFFEQMQVYDEVIAITGGLSLDDVKKLPAYTMNNHARELTSSSVAEKTAIASKFTRILETKSSIIRAYFAINNCEPSYDSRRVCRDLLLDYEKTSIETAGRDVFVDIVRSTGIDIEILSKDKDKILDSVDVLRGYL